MEKKQLTPKDLALNNLMGALSTLDLVRFSVFNLINVIQNNEVEYTFKDTLKDQINKILIDFNTDLNTIVSGIKEGEINEKNVQKDTIIEPQETK